MPYGISSSDWKGGRELPAIKELGCEALVDLPKAEIQRLHDASVGLGSLRT